tara:strand:+ start:512 stop:889 length:378 start_codon:yes stop_codon:yes gene_type:complete
LEKPKILACDFDGTLATYGPGQWPRIGEPQRELNGGRVIDRVKQYKANGWQVILWTCRSGKYLQDAVDWCANLGLTFDAINKNTESIGEREASSQGVNSVDELSPKIYATYYLDDKNVTIEEFMK